MLCAHKFHFCHLQTGLNSNFFKLTVFWLPVLNEKMYVSFPGFGPLNQKIGLNCFWMFAFDL